MQPASQTAAVTQESPVATTPEFEAILGARTYQQGGAKRIVNWWK